MNIDYPCRVWINQPWDAHYSDPEPRVPLDPIDYAIDEDIDESDYHGELPYD